MQDATLPKKLNSKFTVKEQRFIDEYLITGNKSDAYRKTGYQGTAPATLGSRMYRKPHIRAEIDRKEALRAEKAGVDQAWVLDKLVAIASANPNELSRLEIRCCRHCYGFDHLYQWRTEEEFQKEQEAHFELSDAKRARQEAPSVAGGFGYEPKLHPHPHCTHCDGDGIPKVILGDTKSLSPEAAQLYAGIKTTKDGVEIKVHDRVKALEMIARHVGLYKEETATAVGAIAEALVEIQKRTSKAPIRLDEQPKGED